MKPDYKLTTVLLVVLGVLGIWPEVLRLGPLHEIKPAAEEPTDEEKAADS